MHCDLHRIATTSDRKVSTPTLAVWSALALSVSLSPYTRRMLLGQWAKGELANITYFHYTRFRMLTIATLNSPVFGLVLSPPPTHCPG